MPWGYTLLYRSDYILTIANLPTSSTTNTFIEEVSYITSSKS
uniref:Uncharacterized protein n=1 Tax=Caudovirales sp. ctVfb8 TaxID=2825766 RepID=A0A8S5V3Q1_9CAUD|nr:MAG TPA: hypothetical protein [Caudovirales sp. ctVfb8]